MGDTMNETLVINPSRKKLRMRPLKALQHFRNLVADKEDTEQVFHIIRNLSGKALLRDVNRFVNSDAGKARIKKRLFLPPLLDDHAEILKLPKNSVGHAYVKFMESEGLTAAGLVEEFDKFNEQYESFDDLIEWYGNRLRDTHDLLHVLTGYGRDSLGEACVLAFSNAQTRNPGVAFIAFMGGREIRRHVPKDAPIMKAVFEGKRHGKASQGIAYQDIMALLAEPLEAARERMGIKPPSIYKRVHEVCRANGVDPYMTLNPAA